jgi:hypothetical protein
MKLTKIVTILLSGAIALFPATHPAKAHSVCGLKPEEASFRTQSYLITICLGEASFQMILTYHDGTGYKRIPVQQEGDKFRGSDGQHNYIIDSRNLVIGTDGKDPIRERVTQSK